MADIGGARRRAGWRWVLWIVAGIAAAGAVMAVLGIWHLPDRMYPDAGDAEARAALQGGLLTAAAALVAVAGGLIALDETRQANAETKRANEAADVRERAANVNTHVRELYTRAVDQLGTSNNETVRLGGIYALERIATDSPADQRTVVEVLSAFVRIRSTDPALHPPPSADGSGPPVQPAADIRAVVQVLGRLPVRAAVPRCDLTGADLTGPAGLAALTLTRATLICARLSGANLTGADLVEADLTGAWLIGANLNDAGLSGANLTGAGLVGATLIDAWLIETNLNEAWMSRVALAGADLEGADLTGAQLDGAALIGAHLRGTDLTGADLGGADLTYAKDLTAEQAAAADGDAGTRLPDGVERPASWPAYNPPPVPPAGGS